MSEKKRKRAIEEGGRPNKKPASERSASEQIVKFSIVSGNGDCAPAIGMLFHAILPGFHG